MIIVATNERNYEGFGDTSPPSDRTESCYGNFKLGGLKLLLYIIRVCVPVCVVIIFRFVFCQIVGVTLIFARFSVFDFALTLVF